MGTTIRVSTRTRDRLAALAAATGRPMTEVVEEALDAFERRVFFESLNERFEELRADKVAWGSVEAERSREEGAIKDQSK